MSSYHWAENYAHDCEPMDEHAAAEATRIDLEICRCPRDKDGEPSPYNINDLCEAHGGAIWRAIDNGNFWTMDWPWGEDARPAPRQQGERS